MPELRIAVRRLMRRRGASAASVITLACSIGAATLAWSLVSAVLIHPLPVAYADRLVVVGTGDDARHVRNTFSYRVLPLVRDASAFEQVVATWTPYERLTATHDGVSVRVTVAFASHNVFSTLGVGIPLGRGFAEQDDRRGAAPVAVITDRHWRRAFGADPSVIGRTMTLGDTPVTVIGVSAPGFDGVDLASSADLYLPFHTIADVGSPLTNYFAVDDHVSSPTWGLRLIGRIREGDRVAQVLARLPALQVERSGPPARVVLTAINIAALPESARPAMARFSSLLLASVALLLLIGCGTVGMLLLVRTEARRGEFAVRLALGASVPRLVKGVAIEAAILAMAGALLAIPVLWWLNAVTGAFDLPGGVNVGRLGLELDRHVLVAWLCATAAALTVIMATASAAGFATGSARSPRESGLGARARSVPRRTRAILVAAQVAVALVLLAGATLFVKSLQAALALNPGVGMDRVLAAELSLASYGYDAAQANAFFDDLGRRIGAHPAVASVSFGADAGGMSPYGSLDVEGQPRRFATMVRFMTVDSRYLATMGTPVAAGRGFTEADAAGAPLAAVVSASFARQLAGGRGAIGQRITKPTRKPGGAPDVVTVVGIVPDVITNVGILEPLTMYFPITQGGAGTERAVFVRTIGDGDGVRQELIATLRSMDARIAVPPIHTLEERIARQMGPQRLGSAVLGILGGIALLLSMLGAYVAADSTATLRMHELCIRSALGATPGQLGALLLRDNGYLVGAGVLAGLALTWIAAGTIRAFLFEVQPLDPLTLVGVTSAVMVVTVAAALGPAWRAARLDLPRMLRHE